jgi:hypothetical protein
VLPDGQAPRRARVPVAILDDVAANPTGFHPDPKAGEGVLLHDHVLIGGFDPIDNHFAQLFSAIIFLVHSIGRNSHGGSDRTSSSTLNPSAGPARSTT